MRDPTRNFSAGLYLQRSTKSTTSRLRDVAMSVCAAHDEESFCDLKLIELFFNAATDMLFLVDVSKDFPKTLREVAGNSNHIKQILASKRADGSPDVEQLAPLIETRHTRGVTRINNYGDSGIGITAEGRNWASSYLTHTTKQALFHDCI
uniref:SFRICE_011480 n=1 Tax=Spodoptera frugiperda TaxID=7108 RepID=A0A2H1W2Z9_SPOFR